MIDLSVILITRNQQWNVARLIESVLQATSSIRARQITLVDSASGDHTTEIACQYPISVLQLQPDQPLSASAGRYTGFISTSGRFVLFLDGDMALYPGWIEKGLELLTNRPDVGAVTGLVIDRPIGSSELPATGNEEGVNPAAPLEILFTGGAGLYSRAVLEKVGPFNPYLISDEEPELCLRIRHAGYKIIQLNSAIVYHYTDPLYKISTLARRWRRRLYFGAGQAIRYHLGKPLFWNFVQERGYLLLPTVGLLSGLLGLVLSVITQRWLWFGLWIILLAGFIGFDALRKHSLYLTFYSLFRRILYISGILGGFFMQPNLPGNYPARVNILRAEEIEI